MLRGGRPGPTVLLRGDMDALPLQEETGLDYASEVDGSMHACGHDTHVAMLASSARLLAARRDALTGQVVFMFQPGEEGQHGARHMIDEGLLDAAGTPAEKAFALHITSTLQSGVVVSPPRARRWPRRTPSTITVKGRGGHGGMPHDAIDPVPSAAAMVGALQTMIARRVSVHQPAVVSVARIVAGTTTNIIPETALVEGTIRTLSEDTRPLVHQRAPAGRHARGRRARLHGRGDDRARLPGDGERRRRRPARHRRHRGGPRRAWAAPMDDPLMGAEDFSYVLQQVPGAMAFLGACPRGVELAQAAPNHSNRVLFDEAAMEHGVVVYTAFALDALR